MSNILVREQCELSEMEGKLFGKCSEAIYEDREFTEEEQLAYNAFSAVQALRLWKEKQQ